MILGTSQAAALRVLVIHGALSAAELCRYSSTLNRVRARSALTGLQARELVQRVSAGGWRATNTGRATLELHLISVGRKDDAAVLSRMRFERVGRSELARELMCARDAQGDYVLADTQGQWRVGCVALGLP